MIRRHDPARDAEAARAMFDAIDAAREKKEYRERSRRKESPEVRYLRRKQAAFVKALRADLEREGGQ